MVCSAGIARQLRKGITFHWNILNCNLTTVKVKNKKAVWSGICWWSVNVHIEGRDEKNGACLPNLASTKVVVQPINPSKRCGLSTRKCDLKDQKKTRNFCGPNGVGPQKLRSNQDLVVRQRNGGRQTQFIFKLKRHLLQPLWIFHGCSIFSFFFSFFSILFFYFFVCKTYCLISLEPYRCTEKKVKKKEGKKGVISSLYPLWTSFHCGLPWTYAMWL